jgi:alpha-tubulin suppressor-like RCC1 family protein
MEIKKPRRIPLFDTGLAARRILKIVCGGMHTVALSNLGRVYTWGCNDEGALGRVGPENSPVEVIIGSKEGLPITDITAGDSHSIAYNTQINQIYLWGLYRVCILFDQL